MKKIDSIIESSTAPRTNCLWLSNGELKYFSSSGWKSIKSDKSINWVDIIDKPDPYVLPVATTTVIGGVKKTPPITGLALGADASAIVTVVNSLLTALRTAGIVSNS